MFFPALRGPLFDILIRTVRNAPLRSGTSEFFYMVKYFRDHMELRPAE
jgi:hypothetical protein